MSDIEQLDWAKGGGLVPAVIQHELNGTLLMLGYMDRQALRQTLETGYVTCYSREREALWVKGETSGHYLRVSHTAADCDQDALLIQAQPAGPVCHRGDETCFGRPKSLLKDLESVIKERAQQPEADSYTAGLLSAGIDRAAQKLGEEGVETVVAALKQSDQVLAQEAADLLFHLLIVLHCRGLSIDQVWAVLKERKRGPAVT